MNALRLGVGWIFAAMAVWGLAHSLLASFGLKAWLQRVTGENLFRWYRLGYNLFSALSLLPVLLLARLLPDRLLYAVPLPWSLLFVAAQLAAVALLLAGVRQTGASAFIGLDQVLRGEPRAPHLATGGPYRYVRHPLYAAGMLFMLFTPVITANLLALYLSFAAYMVVGAAFEERKLLREFGPAYGAYRAKVGMFLPKIAIRRIR